MSAFTAAAAVRAVAGGHVADHLDAGGRQLARCRPRRRCSCRRPGRWPGSRPRSRRPAGAPPSPRRSRPTRHRSGRCRAARSSRRAAAGRCRRGAVLPPAARRRAGAAAGAAAGVAAAAPPAAVTAPPEPPSVFRRAARRRAARAARRRHAGAARRRRAGRSRPSAGRRRCPPMRRSWCPPRLRCPDRPIRRGCRFPDRPIRRGCRCPRRCRGAACAHHRQHCPPNRRRLPSRQSQTERPSCRWDQLLLHRSPTSREIHQRKERQSRRDVSAFSELRIRVPGRTCARPDARDIWEKDFAPAGTESLRCVRAPRSPRDARVAAGAAARDAIDATDPRRAARPPIGARAASRPAPDADHRAAANATSKAAELPT